MRRLDILTASFKYRHSLSPKLEDQPGQNFSDLTGSLNVLASDVLIQLMHTC